MKLTVALLSTVAILTTNVAFAADLPAKKAAPAPVVQKPQVNNATVPYIAVGGG